MNELYHGQYIRVMPQLNLETDCWIPQADVFWDEGGERHHQTLIGPNNYFKSIDEAEIYAVDMARTWIDSQRNSSPSLVA
jgi:hypothetical protein